MSSPPYPPLFLYVAGQFVSGGARDSRPVLDPASGEVLGHLPLAARGDLDEALSAAEAAFRSWRWTSGLERGVILRKAATLIRERAEAIAQGITEDQGKPIAEARSEVLNCVDYVEWHADEARRIYGRVIPARSPKVRQSVTREPVGVCAAFTPWNYPFNQALRKVVAALGAGCTLVLKGPEESPSAVVALARIFHDAGLPAGCLNIVWGVPSEVSTHLIESPVVRKLSFTGSVPVGKSLAALAGRHMKRITMELGGHSPVLVFGDADVEAAARQLAAFKVKNAGQICISPSRFFVHESVYDRFVPKFVEAYSAQKLGSGLAADTTMGPLANVRRIEAMGRFVDDALSGGGKLLCGGTKRPGPGNFFPPTVVANLAPGAALLHDEPFGPIVPVVPFASDEEAFSRANELPYGLASYVFTRSLEKAHLASRHLEAGMVNVNHFGSALPETPFGGVKDSGVGSEGGQEAFDGYLVTKFVSVLAEPA